MTISNQLTESPDEEALPFKALWQLMYGSNLRIHVEPEAVHCMWNDLRNAYKRADLQPALLLGIVMSQMAHGPFLSGAHQATRQDTAQLLAEELSHADFQALREAMLRDRYYDESDIPETPSDIPTLRSVQSLPIFVSWQLKKQHKAFFSNGF